MLGRPRRFFPMALSITITERDGQAELALEAYLNTKTAKLQSVVHPSQYSKVVVRKRRYMAPTSKPSRQPIWPCKPYD